jgi:hypothetical protein
MRMREGSRARYVMEFSRPGAKCPAARWHWPFLGELGLAASSQILGLELRKGGAGGGRNSVTSMVRLPPLFQEEANVGTLHRKDLVLSVCEFYF